MEKNKATEALEAKDQKFRRNSIIQAMKDGKLFESTKHFAIYYQHTFGIKVHPSTFSRDFKDMNIKKVGKHYLLPVEHDNAVKEVELRYLFEKAKLTSIMYYEFLCIPISNGFSEAIISVLEQYKPLKDIIIGMIPSRDSILIVCTSKEKVMNSLKNILDPPL